MKENNESRRIPGRRRGLQAGEADSRSGDSTAGPLGILGILGILRETSRFQKKRPVSGSSSSEVDFGKWQRRDAAAADNAHRHGNGKWEGHNIETKKLPRGRNEGKSPQ